MENFKEKYGPNCAGVVLRILDKQTLLILPIEDSSLFSEGDKISVYEYSEPILDLDGNELCRFEYIKDTLEVTNITSRYIVCKKTEVITREVSAFALSPLLKNTVTEDVPLKVQESDIEPFKIENEYIRNGDPVKFS